jgi:hypothetical protein
MLKILINRVKANSQVSGLVLHLVDERLSILLHIVDEGASIHLTIR